MKQQIICEKCVHPLKYYPGEWHKTVTGKALKDYICDLCDAHIAKGEVCFAQSFGLMRHFYWPWEGEYLEVST